MSEGSCKRSASNCPFYPACYWAGDCNYEDWRKFDCGRPVEEQRKLRRERLAESAIQTRRWELGERMKSLAVKGHYDHFLDAPDEKILEGVLDTP